MENKGSYSKTTETGFIQHVTKYEATNCHGFLLNGSCHKSKGNRVIESNHHLHKLKQQVNKQLVGERDIEKRAQRFHNIEPKFANINNSHGFKRSLLRGKQKVTIKTGLLAMAHNLRKKAFQKSSVKNCLSKI